MRFTVSSTALSSRLGTLSRVINSKNSIAILDCFLFEVAGGQLEITASDSENVMKTTLTLDEVEGEGSFAVNNRNILDAVKELPEQPLTLDVNLEEMLIKVIYQNGMYKFTCHCHVAVAVTGSARQHNALDIRHSQRGTAPGDERHLHGPYQRVAEHRGKRWT